MHPIEYLKLQAKNLFRDYKTKTPYIDERDGFTYYKYDPKYFDVDGIVCYFDLNEDSFSLMNAQHVIANLVGFTKWTDLIKASETELELAKLLFDNQHKVDIDDWEMYLDDIEIDFNSEAKLEILKAVFVNVDGHESSSGGYLLRENLKYMAEGKKPRQISVPSSIPDVKITSLPLSKEDRVEFIETANSVFQSVIWRMQPRNPELTRKLWNAEEYIDNGLLTNDMLPISKSYALSLIDAFLVHHVLGLAAQADTMAE